MAHNSPGDGTLRLRSDGRTWEYRVSITLSDGSPSQKSFYSTDKTGAGAKKKYKQWLTNNADPLLKIKTFGEWSDKWLVLYKKDKVAPKSYGNYKLYLDKHIKPALGSLNLTDIKPAHIEQLLADEHNLSFSARHHILMELNQIFDSAIDNHYCANNPCARIKVVQKEKAPPKVFSQDELDHILSNCYILPYGTYVAALLYTGLRIGELCALQWGSVDLEGGTLLISQSVATATDKGKDYEIKSTKTGKQRVVALTDSGITLFKMIPRKGLFVFCGARGSFVNPDTFRKRYDKFFAALNEKLAADHHDATTDAPQVRPLSPHKCRHTHATYLLKGGCNIRAVQMQLGHAKLTTTEIYTHPDLDSRKDNIKKLAY